MKKIGSFLFAVVLMLGVVSISVGAVESGDYDLPQHTEGYYTYIVKNGKAIIMDVNEQITGAVAVPATLGGYTVVELASGVFDYCREITKVTIPDSVKDVGYSAFAYCTELKSVVLGNGIQKLGEGAFQCCTSLTKVTFGKKLTEIGQRAFEYCESLTNVTFPKSLKSIGICAFQYCTSLSSVTLPNGFEVIGAYAFAGCSGMTAISIPDTITYIGDSAVAGCSKLPVNIYDSGKYFGNSTNPYVVYISPQWSFMTSFNIHKDTKIISSGAFAYESSIKEIAIPEGVRCIGDYAFHYNIYLEKIDLPDNLIYIGYKTFEGCQSLTSITLPDSVTDIDAYAFTGCYSLKSVKFNKNLEFIGWYAFEGCSSLTSVDIPDSITSIGQWVFADCTNLSRVTIGAGVKAIDDKAFVRCTSLKSIHIPDGVTYIGGYAFNECTSLTDIYLPDTVTEIGSNAFQYCSALTNITVPSGVKKLYWQTFDRCSKLTTIVLPASLTEVSYGVFDGCDSLKQVYYTGTAAQWSAIYIERENNVNEPLQKASIKTNYVPISFSAQPGNQNVKAGATVKFKVATNVAATYQWQYRTATGDWKNISKANGATYSFAAKASHNGYRYRCKATDQNGLVYYSNEAKLQVLGVKVQPANKVVKTGQTAKFTVEATGTGLKYQWQYRTSAKGSWKNITSSVGKKTTCSVSATSSKNGYQYRCKVTDSAGNSVYTKTVTLNVLSVKTQPVSKTVKSGQAAKFTVSATGTGLKYQWQYRTSAKGSWKSVSSSTGKKATYSLTTEGRHNGYQYRCKVTDSAGNSVYTKTVTLNVLSVKTQPVSKTVKSGQTAKFTVKATGAGLKYQWQYRTSAKGSWKNSTSSAGKKSTYSVSATTSKNGYQYRCKVTDSAGNSVYTKTVTLNVLGIKTQPVSKTVKSGQTAKFTVKATGAGLKYQWQYRTSSKGSWKSVSSSTGKKATYSLTTKIGHNGYQYRCKVTDSAGNSVYTKTVTLNVLGIKTQPVSKTVKSGQAAKFTVSATGTGLKYQWQYRTSAKGSWKNITSSAGKKAVYSVRATNSKNGYQYRCRIIDKAGNAVYAKTVKLTVKK